MCLSPAQHQAKGFPFRQVPGEPTRAAPAAAWHGRTSPSAAATGGPNFTARLEAGTALESFLPGCGLCWSWPNQRAHGPAWLQPIPKEVPLPSYLFPIEISSAGAMYNVVLCKAYLFILQMAVATLANYPKSSSSAQQIFPIFFFSRLPFKSVATSEMGWEKKS